MALEHDVASLGRRADEDQLGPRDAAAQRVRELEEPAVADAVRLDPSADARRRVGGPPRPAGELDPVAPVDVADGGHLVPRQADAAPGDVAWKAAEQADATRVLARFV